MAQGDPGELTHTHQSSGPSGLPAAVKTWGEFRLIGELGRGAFGRVYHAWDPTLARDIALKVVHLPDATRAAAALQEGRMLARVRHRNVVTVYGAQQIGDEVGVWMELIRGRHLSQIVREQGPMGPEEATVVGISVCQALAAVHGAGLLHRDVKANNVMRESGGRIVLMDLGAGQESSQTSAGNLAGTPVYMAPEVLNGGPASPGSDLYSVGVLLFYSVTGEYPVFGQSVLELSLAHRRGQRRLLADRRPDLPDGFVRVVERALSPSPRDRPPSAGTMMRELSGALPGSAAISTGTAGGLAEGDLRAPTAEGGAVDPRTPSWSTVGGPAVTDGRSALATAGRAAGLIAAVVFAIGAIGLLTSAAFHQSLGIDAAFSADRLPGDWLAYGARSLFAPVILSAVAFMAGRLIVTAWHALLRVLPPLRRTVRAFGRGLSGIAGHMGVTGAVTLSQWFVVLQIAALGLVWLRFVGLIEAVINPAAIGGDRLVLLADSSSEPLAYRAVVTLLLLAMGLGWHALLSKPGARAEIHRTTIVAGGVVMALALLMLVVPYRLLYHNDMFRADLAGVRCYQLGSQGTQVLLYCPDQPPRIRTADENITRRGIRESIFSPASPHP